MSGTLTYEQRALLERHAEHFEVMASYVRECSPEELDELAAACRATGPTNAWSIFEAARFLERIIRFNRNVGRVKS